MHGCSTVSRYASLIFVHTASFSGPRPCHLYMLHMVKPSTGAPTYFSTRARFAASVAGVSAIAQTAIADKHTAVMDEMMRIANSFSFRSIRLDQDARMRASVADCVRALD